jgi:MFS family permease
MSIMKQKYGSKNPVLLIIGLASFLVPFMGSAINLSLPQIGESFSMGAVSQSWIATIYLIAAAIFQIPFARLADFVRAQKSIHTGTGIIWHCHVFVRTVIFRNNADCAEGGWQDWAAP